MPQEEDESLIIYLKKELEASLIRNDSMEKENQELRQEIIRLKAQISSLKAHDNERKTMLWKKLQNSNDNSAKPDSVHQKLSDSVKIPDQNEEHSIPGPILTGSPEPRKERQFPSPPPPKLTLLVSPPPFKEVIQNKLPPKSAPPPPPLPSKAFMGSKSVRRVPEVVEFYRQLTRKNTNLENKGNSTGTSVNAFTPNMIGEIENRSSHLSAIKSDVEERKDFINNLIKAVDSAAFKEISEVETFVKWLDGELSSLVDERAVLKHFTQWPERKADAIREAAFNYKDLKNLVSEISSFQDNPKESSSKSLKKMQALQDRLETSVNNVEKTREATIKRYKDCQIPWDWLLDTGLIGQMKLSSLRLVKEYMKRIIKEVKLKESLEDNLLLQGARFAYRVHQFAGGFDMDSITVFQELKRVGMTTHKQ